VKRLFIKVIIAFFALVFLAFAVIVVMITLEMKTWHNNYRVAVRDLIPVKIKTEKILADDYEQALPGGWCHGLTFKLSTKSLEEIREQGLVFLKGQVPANPVQIRNGDGYWVDWQEKPNLLSDLDAQRPYGCLSETEKFMRKKGYAIKRDTKIYYTYVKHRGYSNISVYPEWGIVIYSSWAY